MRKIACLLLVAFLGNQVYSQDSILHRVILIGDAGEIDKIQEAVLPNAAGNVIPGKTTVFFLGDNIYPRGLGLPGSSDQSVTENILRSEFQPFRSKGATVYFIPGNHDWDRMGKSGLAKIKRQSQFLEEQNDPQLKLVPSNGCADPVEIPITDSFTVIAFDSEWWLFPFDKTNSADCECKTRDELIARLDDLYYKNRYKVILLASHHPFQSYGTHGGRFALKDHIFPLTAVNKNLYIPLPVIGSLYPILRKTFTNPEDLAHPLYRDMRNRVDKIFSRSQNVTHVAGHEHGLQYIDNTNTGQVQVVSGGGAKINNTVRGRYSKYAAKAGGYVTADFLTGNRIRFTYHTDYGGKGIMTEFRVTRDYYNVKEEEVAALAAYQGDSAVVQVRAEYDKASKFKRWMFGENYRKEFAAKTTLPIIRISEIHGGLTPEKRGGGMQTVSLRLKDKNGKEWVIRNLEKNPDPLLPEDLRETFARDLLDDYMSAQHPFAPLVVPVLADAAGVPHANPIIGVIAPDTALGIYQSLFAGKVALLEEREPIGKSDNTGEMQEKLEEDNDNNYNGKTFLRARLLDLLISDWDRHADQWRWADKKSGKTKFYEPVPRDRDQALYIRQGWVPKLVSRSWVLPTLQGFGPEISRVKFSLFKTQFVHAHMADQFDLQEWMEITNEFKKNITDAVIDSAFRRLPASAYRIRGEKLAADMKVRRENIPAAMEKFYRFINKRMDIEATDKNEFFGITGTKDGGLHIVALKIDKNGVLKDTLLSKTYDRSITKEVRIYLQDGNDSVRIDNNTSSIKLRIIGGHGNKAYDVTKSKRKVLLYDRANNSTFHGEDKRLRKHLSDDSLNTAFIPVNLYNITMPLISIGYNLDDGFVFGLGFKHTHQGFRKLPYASTQQLIAAHSFSTRAYRIRYNAEWIKVLGKADLVANVLIKAPDNKQNFFGRGNNTEFHKIDGFLRYYRARFAIYQGEAGFRWRGDKGSSLTIGPSFQLYRYDAEENENRFISNTSLVGSYDSSSLDRSKTHLGGFIHFTNDKRNSKIFPAWGSFLSIRIQAYRGMNDAARSFMQITPEVSVYKSLNARRTVILANRVGGGISIGKTAFYQSQFIGGHENLLGYRQYRFAGQHSFYNNTELRIKLADLSGYLLPGQIGLTGFFDIGRVWEVDDHSKQWHNGTGAGLYFAPAKLAVLQLLMGYSREGWLPYFTMGFRF